LWIWICEVY